MPTSFESANNTPKLPSALSKRPSVVILRPVRSWKIQEHCRKSNQYHPFLIPALQQRKKGRKSFCCMQGQQNLLPQKLRSEGPAVADAITQTGPPMLRIRAQRRGILGQRRGSGGRTRSSPSGQSGRTGRCGGCRSSSCHPPAGAGRWRRQMMTRPSCSWREQWSVLPAAQGTHA